MVSVIYTDHLKLRLKIRNLPETYPKEIYANPEQKFYDNIEKTYIAIKRLEYNKKLRNMMIAFEKKNGNVEIITLHPIKDEKIINRVISGRWVKYG